MAVQRVPSVAVFADNLNVGGIQKSLVNILGSGVFEGCEVDVFLFSDKCFFQMPELPKNVHIFRLKPLPYLCRAVPFGLLYRFYRPAPELLRRAYDVAIDFDSYQNSTALGALRVNARKRVMWIHNDMSIKLREEPKYAFLWRMMRKKLELYDEFVAVSQGIVESFRSASGRTDCPVHVIPNLIDTGEIFRRRSEEPPMRVDETKRNIASMGRLCHQKGFDLLLPDFQKAHEKCNDLALYLIGDGPDRAALERQVSALGLEEAVHFTGNLSNPFPMLRQMDAFCLESRYEGQGMVLWEAKALGLELVFPKRLEKYNPELSGTEDVVEALTRVQKREKQLDDLSDYNARIRASLRALIGPNP